MSIALPPGNPRTRVYYSTTLRAVARSRGLQCACCDIAVCNFPARGSGLPTRVRGLPGGPTER
ncbi:MAG: hypothetical protein RR837_11615 [Bacteroidales bacterium]